MCESGINVGQLKVSIGQIDDAVALAEQWTEQLHHLADHGHKHDTSVELAQASVLLGEVRAKLQSAIDAVDGRPSDSGVTVELV